ncbi:hypothetical protein BKI52_15620 [marine bacterium AO1-C]|nr:hypothetical protein BKI52_15620 [marine bacterium AO1-C]
MITQIAQLLKKHLQGYEASVPEEELMQLSAQFTLKTFAKRDIVFSQTEVCKEVLLVEEGILASEFTQPDKTVISRFFRPANLCSNLVSVIQQTLASDNIMAITPVTSLSIPYHLFYQYYLHSSTFGIFLRKKLLENMVEAKHFISIKTISDTEAKYQFLETNYPKIIRDTPSKYIANFLGITPEALSRFLARRYKS